MKRISQMFIVLATLMVVIGTTGCGGNNQGIAQAIRDGFQPVNNKLDNVLSRLNKVDGKVDAGFRGVNERLNKLEKCASKLCAPAKKPASRPRLTSKATQNKRMDIYIHLVGPVPCCTSAPLPAPPAVARPAMPPTPPTPPMPDMTAAEVAAIPFRGQTAAPMDVQPATDTPAEDKCKQPGHRGRC